MDYGAKNELQIHKYYFIGLTIILLFAYLAHFRPQNSPNAYAGLWTMLHWGSKAYYKHNENRWARVLAAYP